MKNLKNKTFIITGGGRGIGAEASKLIASKGANVILTCRTESQGFSVEKEILEALAISSKTLNPTLCLVSAYSTPGLPNPIIKYFIIPQNL